MVREQAHDAAVHRRLVRLHVGADAPGVILDLAHRRVEGVADRDVDVLVRVVLPALAADGDLAPRR